MDITRHSAEQHHYPLEARFDVPPLRVGLSLYVVQRCPTSGHTRAPNQDRFHLA